MMRVMEGETGPPLDGYADRLSPLLRDFLEKAFTRDVDARPSARALLRHPFLSMSSELRGPFVAPLPARSPSQTTLETLKARISRDRVAVG